MLKRLETCTELPAPYDLGDASQLGKLRLNLFGARGVTSTWQEKLGGYLGHIGFAREIGHPSLFQRCDKGLGVLVYGDDFVTGGRPQCFAWLKKELEKLYEIATQVLGPGAAGRGKVLNGFVSRSKDGWTLEADLRHADFIIEQMGIKSAGGITTAGAAEDVVATSESVELEGKDMLLFRSLAPRADYFAMDRSDL